MSSPIDVVPTEPTPLSREQIAWRWRILISTYFAYVAYYFARKVFPLVKTSLSEEFDRSIESIAYIWAAFLVAYMVGQFISGFIGRERGARILLLGGLGLSLGCNVVFGFTNSYWTFMVFMIINGLAQASGWPAVVGGVAEWLRPWERGRYMGVWSTGFIVGNLLVKYVGSLLLGNLMVRLLGATALGTAVAMIPSWRWSFFGCTLIAFALWWVVLFWQRNRPEDVGLPPIVDPAMKDVRAIQTSSADHIGLGEYLKLACNPVVLAMGFSYFGLKFLRYALDSWLPVFFEMQGLTKQDAGLYSMVFDLGGIIPVILAGWALDKLFKGDWGTLCFLSCLGLVVGYVFVVLFETNPFWVAIIYGFIGFMLYGPDTILTGAAAVAVAGEKNAVALAGLINGIGSLGPIVQELVIARIMTGPDKFANIHAANLLALSMSVIVAGMMVVVVWRIRLAHRHNDAQG